MRFVSGTKRKAAHKGRTSRRVGVGGAHLINECHGVEQHLGVVRVLLRVEDDHREGPRVAACERAMVKEMVMVIDSLVIVKTRSSRVPL